MNATTSTISSSRLSPNDPNKPTFALSHTLLAHTAPLSVVKFSPDGKQLASSGADGIIAIWDVDSGRHLSSLEGHHTQGVNDLAWSSDSRFIASGSDDKLVIVWSIEHSSPIHSQPLLAHTAPITALSFNPQTSLLASGSKDECIHLWIVRTATIHLTLPAHSDSVSGVHFNRDGTMLVSCSWDGLIRMWDASTGQCLKTIVHEESVPIANISFTLNARHLLSTTLDSTTRLWNYHTSQVVKTFSCPTTAGSSSANVPAKGDEEKAAEEGLSNERLGCASEYLVVPRALVGREMGGQGGEEREGREKEVWIVGGGEDGRVVAWDVQSRQVVLDMRCHEDAVVSIATHPFLPLIATASIDSDFTVKLWRDTLSPSTSSSPLPLPPSTDNACALPSSASNGTAPQETVASIDIGQEAFDGQTEGKVSAGGVMEAMMARDADDVKMHEGEIGEGVQGGEGLAQRGTEGTKGGKGEEREV